MSGTAITVENLSKRYLLGHQIHQIGKPTTLRDVISRETKNFLRKATDLVRGHQIVQGDEIEEFWALKEVSFDVKEGEVVGIIGRNGAGKSTLLKILSRITDPTEGRVVVRGRVASLLEVGTGFHQELTGRENIYLNGAILGMTQKEIRKTFDEIVAFAEVERFLDTPVKRYSSGMYVRLAFAVAAHLDPEILIIDEVLAVGDSEFQKKCLGKMSEVAKGGRTVLFVSHNMATISAFCERVIWLEKGRLEKLGPTPELLHLYRNHYQQANIVNVRFATPTLRWHGLRNRKDLIDLRNDQDLVFDLDFESGNSLINNMQIDIEIMDQYDRMVAHCRSKFARSSISVPANTRFIARYILNSPHLAPGQYKLNVWVTSGWEKLCWIEEIDACFISAANPNPAGAVLEGVKGATVPRFSVDTLLNAEPSLHHR